MIVIAARHIAALVSNMHPFIPALHPVMAKVLGSVNMDLMGPLVDRLVQYVAVCVVLLFIVGCTALPLLWYFVC